MEKQKEEVIEAEGKKYFIDYENLIISEESNGIIRTKEYLASWLGGAVTHHKAKARFENQVKKIKKK